jgi:hypothetical protein
MAVAVDMLPEPMMLMVVMWCVPLLCMDQLDGTRPEGADRDPSGLLGVHGAPLPAIRTDRNFRPRSLSS